VISHFLFLTEPASLPGICKDDCFPVAKKIGMTFARGVERSAQGAYAKFRFFITAA
jgi:hypothetical protein